MSRPIAELAPFVDALEGVFTDIDDTLTHEGALVPAAYAALCAAHSAGLRVVAVTGRPAGWAEVLAATWPVDAVIAENGAFAVHRDESGRGLQRDYFADLAARDEARTRLAEIRARVEREVPRARVADDQWLRQCDVAFDIGETQTMSPEEIAQIRACVEGAGARVLSSSVHLHAFFGAHDKAKMLVRLAQRRWGVDLAARREHYLYVGDSPNDQSGFAYFPVSAGPANVARYAALLAPPPVFVAAGAGGHGFAELMSLVLDRRKR